MINPFSFRNKVRNRGDWDLKSNTGTIFGLGNDGKTQFLFQGNKMEAQDIGNHHYGVTGKSYGFPEDILLKQAGDAQIKAGTSLSEWQKYTTRTVTDGSGRLVFQRIMLPPYGDDPRDRKWIKSGFRYYDSKK